MLDYKTNGNYEFKIEATYEGPVKTNQRNGNKFKLSKNISLLNYAFFKINQHIRLIQALVHHHTLVSQHQFQYHQIIYLLAIHRIKMIKRTKLHTQVNTIVLNQ